MNLNSKPTINSKNQFKIQKIISLNLAKTSPASLTYLFPALAHVVPGHGPHYQLPDPFGLVAKSAPQSKPPSPRN
jgi:hypothetical protein